MNTTVALTLVALFYAVTYQALMIPDVQVSYATDQCVKVVNYGDTSYSCEMMPKKYNHVWVK